MNQLENENKALKENVEKLNIKLEKFTQVSKILETILASQRCVFNKKRLGYQPKKKQKDLKNYFIKAKQSHDSNHGSFDLYMFY
jgi:GTP-sensing pleiotropic transcriptional regulator CodY